jgi:heme O synthase-like polyprenyltransferase
MLIGAFIPLLEIFDRWDAPGLSNDTEYAIFAFVLTLCLLLLVCKLIASAALKIGFISCRAFLRDDRAKPVEARHTFVFAIPPLFVLPLRI